MIEIKRWDNGKVIYTAEHAQDVRTAVKEAVSRGANLHYADLHSANLRSANLHYANLHSANLRSANLHYANLHYADLHYADLRSADLHSANLHYADLHSANLRSANLRSANLHYADLHYAEGLNPNRTDELRILLDQPGKIRAYKVVTQDGYGPFNGGIKYEVGQTYEAKANTNESEQCGAGINLATLPWCLANFSAAHRLLLCEFSKKDIACIPLATDGKFRVHKCKVVKELDLTSIGIGPDGKDLDKPQ